MEMELVNNDKDNATTNVTDIFPEKVRVGHGVRLLGSALNGNSDDMLLLPCSPDLLNIANDIAAKYSCRVIDKDNYSRYINLYDLWLVKNENLDIVEVMDGSIAYGEPIQLGSVRDMGHVTFPCIAQLLKAGNRIQVHYDNGVRIFNNNLTEVTDDPAYTAVSKAFVALNNPKRGIFDCLYSSGQKVMIIDCISFDGGLTFKLPLIERLKLLEEGIKGNDDVAVLPWRVINTPRELCNISKRVVLKDYDAPLLPPRNGVVAKTNSVQPGRVVPWALCSEIPANELIVVKTAEATVDMLGMPVNFNTMLYAWHVDGIGIQIHVVEGEEKTYSDSYVSKYIDINQNIDYHNSSFVINGILRQDGTINAIDCLAFNMTSLHDATYSVRLRVLKNILSSLSGADHIKSDVIAVRNIEELRDLIDSTDGKLAVRRADGVIDVFPEIEVTVQK